MSHVRWVTVRRAGALRRAAAGAQVAPGDVDAAVVRRRRSGRRRPAARSTPGRRAGRGSGTRTGSACRRSRRASRSSAASPSRAADRAVLVAGVAGVAADRVGRRVVPPDDVDRAVGRRRDVGVDVAAGRRRHRDRRGPVVGVVAVRGVRHAAGPRVALRDDDVDAAAARARPRRRTGGRSAGSTASCRSSSSACPACRTCAARRPTVSGWNVVAPGAMRLTTIRLGWPPPLGCESPPYQMLPAASAADIGSQQRSEVSEPASPGASVVAGIAGLREGLAAVVRDPRAVAAAAGRWRRRRSACGCRARRSGTSRTRWRRRSSRCCSTPGLASRSQWTVSGPLARRRVEDDPHALPPRAGAAGLAPAVGAAGRSPRGCRRPSARSVATSPLRASSKASVTTLSRASRARPRAGPAARRRAPARTAGR